MGAIPMILAFVLSVTAASMEAQPIRPQSDGLEPVTVDTEMAVVRRAVLHSPRRLSLESDLWDFIHDCRDVDGMILPTDACMEQANRLYKSAAN